MTMEGCGAKCIKFLLFIINFIVAICGLGLIATGLLIKFGVTDWIPIDEIANLLNSELLRSATYIIIAAGAFVFLVAVCGCFGALCENKCLLILYFLLLFIVFAAQIAAGILAALYTRQISTYLETESTMFLKDDYNRTGKELATAAWDFIQTELMCCGVNGESDYLENTYLQNNGKTYPRSCCAMNDCISPRNSGCKGRIEGLISDYGTIIGATAVGVAFFELCCMLLAICVCRNVGDMD
ncbi:CD151 antigen-like [Acanthaster planci]|uniref:Tetraspanin n=1 Tax=Acanthaster planci TaxID=133434 RepID=A0A8B7XRB1_ACAPL|nr:CD151 antigen-like [Acanthaster planci]XP_022082721.1 CD151 antigen-like [Acanthaster planci]XP_022082722.1 CD151 antigen-like [Acanthaster planci]XP_022082723.1 CD151 antigen-like [Acanthaster planci]XP_022082725.1 CD151 antigen-like [Acanthaster planci]XP_022082726.1 CD151 antigen-like [Acanthaster planci]XP_022082727.1 CD151 antigen-like [Acanthaster planci]